MKLLEVCLNDAEHSCVTGCGTIFYQIDLLSTCVTQEIDLRHIVQVRRR